MREHSGLKVHSHKKNVVDELFVPSDLIHTNSYDTYHTKLEILALSANANNAFLFDSQREQVSWFGEAQSLSSIDFSSILDRLNILPTDLQLIKHQSKHWLLIMRLSDDLGHPLGLVGSCLTCKEIQSANNCEITLDGLFNADQQRLISLNMRQFQEQMMSHSKSQVLQLIHSQHLQLSALNQDYICIKDEAHRLVYANPAMLNTFPAQARDKVLGNDNSQYYSSETFNKLIETDVLALSTGLFKGVEHIHLANGDEKILQTSKKSFVGVDGKKYLMSVSRDITEKEILIGDLKRSNADLDNFAYVASHDLKAPLNAIKRLVSWVKEDCDDILPNESKDDLAIVLSRTERMEKLLNDLLSYSRIGKEYQEATRINLKEFVVELLSLIDLPMGFVMNCDNVDIKVPLIPFNVVMLNLVSNAIKHHDSGNAKIQIKAKSNEKGCVISILDNGPGIEEKNRERIFKLFETLKPRDEVEGSGMGLSVVKKIVEHYGGHIKVDANKPRGTKFVVTWPINNIARSVWDNINA